jgi:ankyrin repeat protein
MICFIWFQPPERSEAVKIKIDSSLEYLFDYTKDSEKTRQLVEKAIKQELVSGDTEWDPKYNLPKLSKLHYFAENVYINFKTKNSNAISQNGPWRLLYRVKGKVLKKLNGFNGELFFNTDSNHLLLAIKGTNPTSLGDLIVDLNNVILKRKGRVINSAFTFGEKVRELILKFKCKCKPMLVITGHSLGGYLAQIMTYAMTYCYLDEKGIVRSKKEPTDEFGIYTMVFDAPAVSNQIFSIDERNPLDPKRFVLPIINFVKDKNCVNRTGGPHLGQVIAITGFQDLETQNWLEMIWNRDPLPTHGMINFKDTDNQLFRTVENFPGKRTVPYDKKVIPAIFFFIEDFESLYAYAYAAQMSVELKKMLPEFTISKSCVILKDENASAEEFIPRAHRFLSLHKDELKSGKFNGKQIVNMAIYNMWRAEMKKDDHELSLHEDWITTVQEWGDGTKIGGFTSYEEMRFVGCLIHNSIPGWYHYDFAQFNSINQEQKDNFAATTKATLILIVKKGENINHEAQVRVKKLYLVLDGEDDEKFDAILSKLDGESRKKLEETELDFMGNKVRAIDIFGEKLLEELPLWSILSIIMESALQEEFFYSNQAIASQDRKSKFKSATDFAQELKKQKLKFVLISSDAGMGKSTALKQIAKTLQDELESCWIVHLNLFHIQAELSLAKKALTSKEAAVELVRNAVLKEIKNKKLLKKIFDWKLETRQMVLLLDSLDEICPYYRDTADKLLALLRETKLQIVVTTRPHEGKNLSEAIIFNLQPLDERTDFIRKQFESLKRSPPEDIDDWFSNISSDEDSDFWNIPLSLVMIVYIYGDNLEINAGGKLQQKANIYSEFLKKTMHDTMKDKLKMDQYQATSEKDYKEKIEKYYQLIEILAVCTIFYEGTVSEKCQQKIAENGEFINRFVVAKLYNEYKNVSFLHRSYAEHLVARAFHQQLTLANQKTLLNRDQRKSILFEIGFSGIRKHICGIIATSSKTQITLQLDIIKGSEKSLIRLLIKEDLYELYLLLKNDLRCAHKDFVISEVESINLLYLALKYARKQFLQDIINDGANFETVLKEKNVLVYAVKKDLYEQVKSHIASLILDINSPDFDNEDDERELLPLDYAARNGNRKMAKLLVKNGALVKRINTYNEIKVSLLYAIESNSHEVVDFLIEKGADMTKALLYASELNRIEMFKTMYSNTPNELKEECLTEVLSYFAKEGNLEKCKFACSFEEANPADLDEDGETSVHWAAREGHLECVQYLLEKQESVDVRNRTGETPLMVAIRNKHSPLMPALRNQQTEVVEWLLSRNADVNAKDSKGWTTLFYASKYINGDTAKFLLEKGANPTHTDNEGNTCLHIACKYGNSDCVKLLLDLNLPVNCKNHKQETPLHIAAASYYNKGIVALLLEKGADPNIKNADGNTSFHCATQKGIFANVRLFIEMGADVNAEDKNGKTCLHYAAKRGNLQCVELLVDSRAEIDAKDNEGWTPLFHALQRGLEGVANYLLGKGANPNLADKEGNTILHIAIKGEVSLECVKLLVDQHKMSVNCRNHKQETPLHVAFQLNWDEAIAAFLLERGADPYLKNADEKTILHMAAEKGYDGILMTMIENRSKYNAVEEIDAKDNKGTTALFYALYGGRADVVNYLLEKGAKPTQTDNEGNTCLHIASKGGSMYCVKLLLDLNLPVNCQNHKQETPLHFAAAEYFEDIVALLLEKGADPNIKNADGETSLHMVATNDETFENFETTARLLIEKGADVNAVDINGKTCLHNAAEDRLFGLHYVEFLVVSGAEIDSKDNKGWSPIFYALNKGWADVANYLLGKGANPYHTDNEGNTSLHIARRNNVDEKDAHIECVKLLVDRYKIAVNGKNFKQETPLHFIVAEGFNDDDEDNFVIFNNHVAFLLKRGADPNIENVDGQTSLHLAAKRGKLDTVQLLIEKDADVNVKDKNGETPNDIAERLGKNEVAEYLRGHQVQKQ